MEGRQKKLSLHQQLPEGQSAGHRPLLSTEDSVRQLGLPRATEGMWGDQGDLGLQEGAWRGQALCSAGPVTSTETFHVQGVCIRKHFTCNCLAAR